MSEPSQDLINDALSLLERIKDTGKIRKGTNEVTKCIERGKALLVYIGVDVSPPEIIRHLPLLSKEKHVAYLNVPSAEDLGRSAGIDVSAASVAIEHAGGVDAELKSIVERVKQFN
ncbi:MAG: ribosomal L7Ae/L30e/S12e/Gadd45 family protein [Candidatus Heimdallarchaeota archaeon]|nr:ribosomal L7Ae/L30e/S12e/Gadd45 family protein [Candidatus Heimdallarchaeota archaeon]MDH5644653.1 ribosomal L7Ae/L30e/S12e/Gadd45 family protein [Candidatus Heimdallarchaeota archaeon]